MSDHEDRLDRLLFAPLVPAEDRGFSGRVMARIGHAGEREAWLETSILAIAAGLLFAFLAAAGFSEWAGRLGDSLATSTPLAIAALALTITWSIARFFAE